METNGSCDEDMKALLQSARSVRWLGWDDSDACAAVIADMNAVAAARLQRILGGATGSGCTASGSDGFESTLRHVDSEPHALLVVGNGSESGTVIPPLPMGDTGAGSSGALSLQGPSASPGPTSRGESDVTQPAAASLAALESASTSSGLAASFGIVASPGPPTVTGSQAWVELEALIAGMRRIVHEHTPGTSKGSGQVVEADAEGVLRGIVHRLTIALHPIWYRRAGQYVVVESEHALVNCWHGHSLELLLSSFSDARVVGGSDGLGLRIKGYVCTCTCTCTCT